MEKVTYHTNYRYEPNMEVKTLAIDLIYVFKRDLDQTFNIEMVRRMLSSTATGYETEKIFRDELLKRLIIGYSVNLRDVGDTTMLRFSLTIPKENLVEDYSIDSAIEFFKNAIFNPIIKDNGFDPEIFGKEHEALKRNFLNSKNSVYAEAERRFMKYADPEQKIRKDYNYNQKLVESVTPQSAYQFYLDNIVNNNYLIYIGGCCEEKTAKHIYETYFKQDVDEFEIELDYYKFKNSKEEVYNEEEFEFTQSALFMEYVSDNINKDNLEYYSMLSNILSTQENELIFKSLRIDNNLVYTSYCNKLLYHGLFYIEAYLSEENKDKAIEVVKSTIDSLRNKEFLKECVDRLIEGIELDLIRELDRKYQKLETRINDDLHLRNLQEILDKYKSIDLDDLIKYLDSIKLNNVLFVKGDSNGKN